jgi:hypothetical protein
LYRNLAEGIKMNGRFFKFSALAFTAVATMFANTVTISNIHVGAAGTFGPYAALVNGVSTTVYCDDPFEGFSAGSYTANEVSVPNAYTTSPNTTLYATRTGTSTNLYDELAWLVMQFSAHPLDTHAIQDAIWYIVDNQISSPPPLLSGVGTLTSNSYVTTVKNMQFSAGFGGNVQILTIVGGANKPGNSGTQELLIITPEPATYAMLGSGLILLSLATFRRRKAKVS